MSDSIFIQEVFLWTASAASSASGRVVGCCTLGAVGANAEALLPMLAVFFVPVGGFAGIAVLTTIAKHRKHCQVRRVFNAVYANLCLQLTLS